MNAILFRTLMICNYMDKLPRCREDGARASRTAADSGGIIAKQTQGGLALEVGDLGYLSSSLITRSPGPRVEGSVALVVTLMVLVMSARNL